MDSINFSCFCFVFQFLQQKTFAAKCLNYDDFWEKLRMTKDEKRKGKDLVSKVEKEEKDRKNKRHLCANVHLQLQLLLQN